MFGLLDVEDQHHLLVKNELKMEKIVQQQMFVFVVARDVGKLRM